MPCLARGTGGRIRPRPPHRFFAATGEGLSRMSISSGFFEMRTHGGAHVPQPSTAQLAAAISALASPDNTYLYIQPLPDTGWYAEVSLQDPATAHLFEGPYNVSFEDSEGDPRKYRMPGVDPEAIAARISTWIQSMISTRP
jgi:hypothetical protein